MDYWRTTQLAKSNSKNNSIWGGHTVTAKKTTENPPTEYQPECSPEKEHSRFYRWFTETLRLYLFTIVVITWTAAALWKPLSWLVWDTWAEPMVDEKIDCELRPIIRELEFQNSLLMKDMTLEEIRRLEREYAEYQKVRSLSTPPVP